MGGRTSIVDIPFSAVNRRPHRPGVSFSTVGSPQTQPNRGFRTTRPVADPQPRDQQFDSTSGFSDLDFEDFPEDPAVEPAISTAREHERRGREGPASAPPPANPHWKELRDALTNSHIYTALHRSQLNNKRCSLEQQFLTAEVQKLCSTCPHCQSSEPPFQHTTSDQQQVLVVGVQQRCIILIPRRICGFCNLQFTIKPTQLGCLPATPVEAWDLFKANPTEPVTWIDLQLLQICDQAVVILRRVSVQGLTAVFDAVHRLNGCTVPLNQGTFRRQLGVVLLEYGYLVCFLNNMQKLGVEDYPDAVLSQCGGCWEAGQDAKQRNGQPITPSSVPLHSLSIDFLFKLGLLARNDRPGDQLPPNHRFFIPDSEVDEFVNGPAAAQVSLDADKSCSDFNADKVTARKSRKYHITGLGAALCRHGHIAKVMNIFTGEKYGYATLFIYLMLVTFAVPILFIWYDINCRYQAYFLKWVECAPAELYQYLRQLLDMFHLLFPIPPFHKYAHSAICQRLHNALKMRGCGRGFGEPNEILNAQLGPHGQRLQYMTKEHRAGVVERVLDRYTEEHIATLPQMLMDMADRAHFQRLEALQQIHEVVQQLQHIHPEWSVEEIKQRMLGVDDAAEAAPAGQMPWQAEYAKCRIIVHRVMQNSSEATPPLSLLFPDKQIDALTPESTSFKAYQRRVAAIEREYLDGLSMDFSDEQFADAFAALRDHMATQLKQELQQLSRSHWQLNHFVQHLTGRPREQKQVLKNLNKSKMRTEGALALLKRWITGSFFGRATAQPEAQQWQVEAILQMRYPWEAVVDMDLGALSSNDLLLKLQLHTRRLHRADEELQLLDREKLSTLKLHALQGAAILSAIRDNALKANECGDEIIRETQMLQYAINSLDPNAPQRPALDAAHAHGLVTEDMIQLCKSMAANADKQRYHQNLVAILQSKLAFLQQLHASAVSLFGIALDENTAFPDVHEATSGRIPEATPGVPPSDWTDGGGMDIGSSESDFSEGDGPLDEDDSN